MRKPYRPTTVSADYLNETLGKIEDKASDYAQRREQAKQKYDEFMAWSQESPQEVAEWREEREQGLKSHGRLWVDDDPVEIYEAYLQHKRDVGYRADAEKLRAIIAAINGDTTELSDELYELVQPYNYFIRPPRFWEKEGFEGIPGLVAIAAAIYYFSISAVGWFFIGISVLISLFFFIELSKGGGRVNGIMLLPAIFLLIIGILMVGTDAVMGLFE